jgi:hypothetical protein
MKILHVETLKDRSLNNNNQHNSLY